MARYTGPKDRLSRREGFDLFGKGGKLTRLNVPPGVHGPKGSYSSSQYSKQLREKQKVKRLYGLLEKQFRRYVDEALKSRGNTGELLLSLIERRLDNVVYRLGFAPTRAAARQIVGHKHVEVDGKRVNIPSYQVKVGQRRIMIAVLFYAIDLAFCVYAMRKLTFCGVQTMCAVNLVLVVGSAGHNVTLFGYTSNFGNIPFALAMTLFSFGAIVGTVEQYQELLLCVVFAFVLRTLGAYTWERWNGLHITTTLASFMDAQVQLTTTSAQLSLLDEDAAA